MLRPLRTFNPLMLFGAAAAVAVILAATAIADTVGAPATFRLAHLSPDAPALDIYVDGVLHDSGLQFGQVGPTRSNGRNGPMVVAARLAGTSPESLPLISAEVNLHPGTAYVVAVANVLTHLQVGAYAIATGDLSPGFARVQVLHAAPNAPRVGVRADREVIASGLGYLEDPVYLDVPPGEARVIGFTAETPTTLLFDHTRTLEAGTVEMVIVIGPPYDGIFLTARPGS